MCVRVCDWRERKRESERVRAFVHARACVIGREKDRNIGKGGGEKQGGGTEGQRGREGGKDRERVRWEGEGGGG